MVYQVDIRELLNRFRAHSKQGLKLNLIPDNFFENLKNIGVEFFWPLGIFEPSKISREVSITMRELHRKYTESLPDWKEEDVIGSPYAITTYSINKDFGGKKEYEKFRKRLSEKFNLKLILDFVPNHFAIDSPFVQKKPEFFIQAPSNQSNINPSDFRTIKIKEKYYLFVCGREPFSPSWKDTFQLDYRSKKVHKFMTDQLLRLSDMCDGVRCDMSMLILSDIFFNNWKNYPLPSDYIPISKEFWYESIKKVKQKNPDFVFIAEVYWNREDDLIDLGFDYVYEKKIYDALVDHNISAINKYIKNIFMYRGKRLLFIENHDEQRSACIFSENELKAAATLIYTLPSMKLIYEGQLEGRKFHHAIQLKRLNEEKPNQEIKDFYKLLFSAINKSTIVKGYFKFLEPIPAWEGNLAFRNFITYIYEDEQMHKDLIVVNLSSYQSQCRVKIETYDIIGKKFLIKDRLSNEEYLRDGDEMFYQGLYLDLKPYQAQIFEFIKQD